MEKRNYIALDYTDKDDAKLLGCKWDIDAKKWYFTDNNKNKDEILRKYNVIPKTDKRFYLNLRYTDKERAKELGCKWDNDTKKWYVLTSNANYDIIMSELN